VDAGTFTWGDAFFDKWAPPEECASDEKDSQPAEKERKKYANDPKLLIVHAGFHNSIVCKKV
jgi:hypothetical protein